MSSTVYALLVGIDQYPAPTQSLHGCVNDVRAIRQLLEQRVSGPDIRLEAPRVLENDQATRDAVIDGFRTCLGRAGPGDVALFFYSGHGAQGRSPPEFWHLEPDRLDETLVCWNSRMPGQWDLADKELGQLVAEVAERGPHVVVILDCCHSGTGTRAMADEQVLVRRAVTDMRERPVESYIVNAGQARRLAEGAPAGRGRFVLPAGRHVVLSACRPEEEATELFLGDAPRGVFSYFLEQTLSSSGRSLSYRDLCKRVNALVRARVACQSPQIEAVDNHDLDQPFLGGTVADIPDYYTLRYEAPDGWRIDGGVVHGIARAGADETTRLAIFPLETPARALGSLENAVGEASVTQVFAGESAVDVVPRPGLALDPGLTYKAIVTALPLPPLEVAFVGDPAALELLRTALRKASPEGKPSLLVRESETERAELMVVAGEGCYRIRRKGEGYPLAIDTPGASQGSEQLVVQRLEHIAKWRTIAQLANPASRIRQGDVRMEVLLPDRQDQWKPADVSAGLHLAYECRDGSWVPPQFKLRLTNTSSRRLYAAPLDLPETYGVASILRGCGVWLEPGQEAWALDGEPLYARVPDGLWRQGLVEIKDTLKLIVSTQEFDVPRLLQDDLPVAVTPPKPLETKRGFATLHTLDRLMLRTQTRHVGEQPGDVELVDWSTADIHLTTSRPLATAGIRAGAATQLGHGVSLRAHARLQGRARLTSLAEAGRDAGNQVLPPLLRDLPGIGGPYQFALGRGGQPGLSVLELMDVADTAVVTPEEPLVVDIAGTCADDAYLLALGHDGEFFLPLGRVENTAGGRRVILERLPTATSGGVRDLKGSIKILFQKLAGQYLGAKYDYPQLSLASAGPGGEVRYARDAALLRDAIGQAENILLYVHGIIGDTRVMAASAFPHTASADGAAQPGLGAHYQAILTFDYENIDTSIEQNARMLGDRLAAVGLGPGHGKSLHVVAHSMGGLVCRWFIEREGGNQVVGRLVMAGTPSGGSAWATVQDWATVALSVGLNGLGGVAWPAQALAALVGMLESVDVTLDEMRPGSDFLARLSASPDPHVSYTVISGDASVEPAALRPSAPGQQSLFERLWQRVGPRHWLAAAAGPVFFGAPNDLAVSIASIEHVEPGRVPPPAIIQPVACDHLTYFSSAPGLRALSRSLGVTPPPD